MKHNFLSERAFVKFLRAVMRDFVADTQSPRKPHRPSSSGRWCVFRLKTCLSLNLDIPLILHIGHFPPVLPCLVLSSPGPSCSGLRPTSLCSKLHPRQKSFSGSTSPHSLSRHLCRMRHWFYHPPLSLKPFHSAHYSPTATLCELSFFQECFRTSPPPRLSLPCLCLSDSPVRPEPLSLRPTPGQPVFIPLTSDFISIDYPHASVTKLFSLYYWSLWPLNPIRLLVLWDPGKYYSFPKPPFFSLCIGLNKLCWLTCFHVT